MYPINPSTPNVHVYYFQEHALRDCTGIYNNDEVMYECHKY